MWTRSPLTFLLGVLAAIEVQAVSEELCPRQETPPGVLVLKPGSNVVFGCRGDITVDGVPLTSASVMNKKYRNKQREDITVSFTSQKGYASATQLNSIKGNATTGTYYKTDSAVYTKAKGDATVTAKPLVTIRKEQATSRRVLRVVPQTTGQDEEVSKITMGTDFEQDDYEDYDYEEERSRVTRGIKNRTRWTLNGRQVHAGVERGGILRQPDLRYADAGNYSCYRGERLISTHTIRVGVPPETPTVHCNRKYHTSKLRCDWTSKNPVKPQPLCYLLLFRGMSSDATRVNCSFSRSRCWCAFPVKEGDKTHYTAKLCVSNTAGSAVSPYISFNLHDMIRPDPPVEVLVREVEGHKHRLQVSWSFPSSWKKIYYALRFELRYRPQLKEQYQLVEIGESITRKLSCTIYDALPNIKYEVQLRAKDEYGDNWSDWTETVYAVTWKAPEMSTTGESTTLESLDMFSEGSGGSGEDPGAVTVDGAEYIEYATAVYVPCALGLCLLVGFTMLTVCLLRNRLHFMSRIGKQTLPFAFFLHSPRPLPAPVQSEQLPEEGMSLMSPPQHSQQDFLPVHQELQECIHLHNIDYFLSPCIDRHE